MPAGTETRANAPTLCLRLGRDPATSRSWHPYHFTLRTTPYTLTQQDFSNYSASMDAEFVALEEKVQQTVQLCQRLRDENRDLRERLTTLQGDHRLLGEKIDGARARIESLLKQIPE